jgi:hypothetical protein
MIISVLFLCSGFVSFQMSEFGSRTSLVTIKSIGEMLKLFSMAEMFFVLHQNSIISKLDRMRLKKIADGVRFMYGGNQPDAEVALLIDLLSSTFAQSTTMQSSMLLSAISFRRSIQHVIVPFTTVCPSCGESLSSIDTKQRSVKVYCRNGSVVGGMSFFSYNR